MTNNTTLTPRADPTRHMAAWEFVQLLFRLGVRVPQGFTPAVP